jgi:dolichol-phosphate mannosyltransferase
MVSDMAQAGGGAARLEVSVVIPAYNEEEVIEPCVREVMDVLRATGKPFEVIVIDDGSRDRTREILKGLRPGMPELVIIGFKGNHGETAGWDAGFKAARGAAVVTIDADMQNDPHDIPQLLELIGRYDVVSGYRRKRNDSIVRRISSRIANWTRNKMTHDQVRDVGCSLRAIRRECLKDLKLYKGMHRFLPTLLKYDGCTTTEIPVNHRPRLLGKSKYGIGNRLFRGIRDLMAVRWMRSRWLSYEIEERVE